ncbi:MAG TPA: hypothetical protein PLU71_05015 [Candidatus Dependentiae bacterium]|nr:hypothetical protein [Candidatus Dependentiae bacterium]HRQ63196.1 hypothetical protein [Candidatus Dependentiae bacterium]
MNINRKSIDYKEEKQDYPQYATFEYAKANRDLNAELNNTKQQLHYELSKLCYTIESPLSINRSRNIQQKGKPHEWSYIAWYQKDNDGNTYLKCSAGFMQIGEEDIISILVPEIKKKK